MTRKKTTKDPINFGEETKVSKKDQICRIIKKGKDKFLTQSQREYYDKLRRNQITVCSGPAGVGKSFIAMKAAVDLLAEHDSPYEKIIIVRPAVEAEEKLGSLPGNVEEKLDPYIFPSYYLLNKIIGKESREKLKAMEVIEVFAEAQNATPKQMKLLLTRIGTDSKFFISGDLEQTDRYKDKKHSGLWDALERLKNMSEVGVHQFGDEDVVRNPIITELLKRYEDRD